MHINFIIYFVNNLCIYYIIYIYNFLHGLICTIFESNIIKFLTHFTSTSRRNTASRLVIYNFGLANEPVERYPSITSLSIRVISGYLIERVCRQDYNGWSSWLYLIVSCTGPPILYRFCIQKILVASRSNII